ncbi:hypothetical protein [Flagellimonas lutaonensis]|nr:hypothetical protein [Allomuricauda lutaonensis]
MDLFELNRKVDRLLFDALPDKPESAYEKQIFGQVANRDTMNALDPTNGSVLNPSNSIRIGESSFDPETKEFSYRKVEE